MVTQMNSPTGSISDEFTNRKVFKQEQINLVHKVSG